MKQLACVLLLTLTACASQPAPLAIPAHAFAPTPPAAAPCTEPDPVITRLTTSPLYARAGVPLAIQWSTTGARVELIGTFPNGVRRITDLGPSGSFHITPAGPDVIVIEVFGACSSIRQELRIATH